MSVALSTPLVSPVSDRQRRLFLTNCRAETKKEQSFDEERRAMKRKLRDANIARELPSFWLVI